MKLMAKPISSPGRPDKYPPPLMRFLRSNVGSRSRGRSRSSPMFVRKKTTAIETQEPSSPKVTCMGQVRVKRSKQASAKPSRPGAPAPRRPRRRCQCQWIRNALFCHHFPERVKPKPCFRLPWKKWGAFFNIGYCCKPKIREDSSKFGSQIEDSVKENEEEEESEEEEGKEAKIFVSSSTPPKNALLLTRCRSAPYRSSSLACRFWGSPLADQDQDSESKAETETETEHSNRAFKEEEEEEEKPTSEKEFISGNPDKGSEMGPETEGKSGFPEKIEGKKGEMNEQELKTEEFGSGRPLILTRCKSEPASRAQRLDPEMSLWRKRRI